MSSTTETAQPQISDGDGAKAPAMVQEEELRGLPRDELPQHGTGTRVAYDMMTNELQRASNRIARHIAQQIAAIGPYELITDGSDLPVLAFRLAPSVTNYTVFDVSARLRENGWLVPAYTFPENREDLSVLRVVVRAGLTTDMADLFLTDLRKQTALLASLDGPLPDRRPDERHSFKH
jgi:glutamate decarboxylase